MEVKERGVALVYSTRFDLVEPTRRHFPDSGFFFSHPSTACSPLCEPIANIYVTPSGSVLSGGSTSVIYAPVRLGSPTTPTRLRLDPNTGRVALLMYHECIPTLSTAEINLSNS